MNSILKETDDNSIANQVRLERAVHLGSFLLVEGDSDSKLFGEFVDKEACSIVNCKGRPKLLDALTKLEIKGIQGVLGFADRDFSEILGYPSCKGTIVFTDENDIELMILCSNALNRFLVEYGNSERISEITNSENRQVCDLIYDAGRFIGTLRLISQKEDWSLKFSGMKYEFIDFTPKNPFFVDEVKMIRYIVDYTDSNMRPGLSDDQILAQITEILTNCTEPKKLCSGHDCIRILGKALKRILGSKNQFVNEKGARELERILRLTYDYETFQETRAYSEIRKWEKQSGFTTLR